MINECCEQIHYLNYKSKADVTTFLEFRPFFFFNFTFFPPVSIMINEIIRLNSVCSLFDYVFITGRRFLIYSLRKKVLKKEKKKPLESNNVVINSFRMAQNACNSNYSNFPSYTANSRIAGTKYAIKYRTLSEEIFIRI